MKLIVWDFDGTLADSRALIVAGMEHALKALALENQQGLREEWMRYVGLPVEEGLARTFAPLGVDSAEVLKAYRSFDWKANECLLTSFPGMPELVTELHELKIPMAIASSKRGLPLRRQVAMLGWTDFFNPIVTPDEVQNGKPHPESLERCLAAHALSPAEAVMVGDTPFDLEMANAACVPAIAIGHGFYDKTALLACAPVAYAETTAELREILLKSLSVN